MSAKVQHPVAPAPATFDIFVLGTRSSGKSVLLASLYRQLSSMDGITNFFARCDDPEQHRELCDNYDQLLDTEAAWPAGTYRVDSYDMGCFHRLRGKSLPVFSIRFHDYPGGYVSDQIERREFIEERAEQCNSVMALIDGRKLLDRLEDREVNPAHSLHKDLDSLVRVLQQCVGKPIHFVLTKADLLDPVKHPLKGIVAELRRHKGLSDILVQQVDSGASCCLVPVSAIGSKFARLDPEDGLIKKRHNGTIEPFHLDVMTSVSMVDTILDLVRTAAPPYEPEAGNRPALLRLKDKLGNKLGYARMAAPATYPIFGPLGVVGIVAVTTLAERYIATRSKSFEDKVREIRQGITDRESALEAILNIQYQLLDRFLKRLPDARLGARFDPSAALAPVEAKLEGDRRTVASLASSAKAERTFKQVDAVAQQAAPAEAKSKELVAIEALKPTNTRPPTLRPDEADLVPEVSVRIDARSANSRPAAAQLSQPSALTALSARIQKARIGAVFRLWPLESMRHNAALALTAASATALVGYFTLQPVRKEPFSLPVTTSQANQPGARPPTSSAPDASSMSAPSLETKDNEVRISDLQIFCNVASQPDGSQFATYRTDAEVTAPVEFAVSYGAGGPGKLRETVMVSCGGWSKIDGTCIRRAGQPKTTHVIGRASARPNEDPKNGPRFPDTAFLSVQYAYSSGDPGPSERLRGVPFNVEKYYSYSNVRRQVTLTCRPRGYIEPAASTKPTSSDFCTEYPDAPPCLPGPPGKTFCEIYRDTYPDACKATAGFDPTEPN